MTWLSEVYKCKRTNEKLNKYSTQAIIYFHKLGFDTCILKGQGNTIFYPNPLTRTTGDIDLWTIPSELLIEKIRNRLHGWRRWALSSRMVTFMYIRHLFPTAEFKCQHIQFPIWKKEKVDVEVHFYPMYLVNLWNNRYLQNFFRGEQKRIFARRVSLIGSNNSLVCPDAFFNAIYQLTHINIHVLIEGIGLRQLIDYYYCLVNLPINRHAEVLHLIKKMRLERLASSVMWIEHEIFGLPSEKCYILPNEKRGRKLLNEIEIGGNFGKFDTRMQSMKKNFWSRQIRKLINHSYFIIDYPSEVISEPFFRLAHWIWRQWFQLKWKLGYCKIAEKIDWETYISKK